MLGFLADLPWGQIVQGISSVVSLYILRTLVPLIKQHDTRLGDHDRRLSTLENPTRTQVQGYTARSGRWGS